MSAALATLVTLEKEGEVMPLVVVVVAVVPVFATHSKKVNAIAARPVVFPMVMVVEEAVDLVAEAVVPVFAMHSKRVNAIVARPVVFPTVMVVEVVPLETSVTATKAKNRVLVTPSNVVNVIVAILAVIPTMVPIPVEVIINPVRDVLVGCVIPSKRVNVTVAILAAFLTKLLRTTRSFI